MTALTTSQVWRRSGRWLARLVMSALVALLLTAATIVTILPRATHGAALTVLSGSMTPRLPVGSAVLIRPVDPGTLHVGDIATYQKEPGKADYVTHRIVAIDTSTTPATFTFKGDANRGADIDPVPATAIRGKVWFSVPYLGSIRDAVHTKGMLFLLAIIALGGYAVFQLTSALRDRRRKASAGEDLARRDLAPSSDIATSIEPNLDDASGHDTPAGSDVAPRGHQVLVMTFRAGQPGRLAPEPVAWALGGTLIKQGADVFSVVVVETADRLPMTLALLETLEPLRIQRFEQVSDTGVTLPSAPAVVELDAVPALALMSEGRVETQ